MRTFSKMEIIFRAKTEKCEDLERIVNQLKSGEFAVVPESMQILIKDKEGFWSVVK